MNASTTNVTEGAAAIARLELQKSEARRNREPADVLASIDQALIVAYVDLRAASDAAYVAQGADLEAKRRSSARELRSAERAIAELQATTAERLMAEALATARDGVVCEPEKIRAPSSASTADVIDTIDAQELQTSANET